MADLLRAFGFHVSVASSVAGGLALAEERQALEEREPGARIDLLVSDIGLPDGSGLDLIRALGERWGIRGIALSGYGTEEDVQRSREAGFLRHLTKPVTPRVLEAAVREALNRKI
jgi:DNA-binding response OmpR family regulator